MSNTLPHNDNVNALAKDLSKQAPRSPRDTLGGFVILARALDKCRSVLAGTGGDYHYDCPLDNIFFGFIGISGDQFKAKVAEGGSDDEIAAWVQTAGNNPSDEQRIQWNNEWRDKRISELPIEAQVFLEGYIPECIPAGRVVYNWFDVYDLEEGRL